MGKSQEKLLHSKAYWMKKGKCTKRPIYLLYQFTKTNSDQFIQNLIILLNFSDKCDKTQRIDCPQFYRSTATENSLLTYKLIPE